IACQQTITAEQNCSTVHRQRHSTARTATAIISDQDPKFTSNFLAPLVGQFGTKLQFSSAYPPHIDGQTERVNQTMEQLIRTTCTDPRHGRNPFRYWNSRITTHPPRQRISPRFS
ncbi:hypothetical protein CLOP_g8616, partial [Closterium sp. NIES-67]